MYGALKSDELCDPPRKIPSKFWDPRGHYHNNDENDNDVYLPAPCRERASEHKWRALKASSPLSQ